MNDDPGCLTIARASELVRKRALSPVELTEAVLRRIEALDPCLDAFVTVTAEHALAQARAAESEIARGTRRGPLHGIPFGLKDIYETRGIPTTAHSHILEHNVPAADAATVALLYDAGAVLVGKLATHEFAHGGPSFDLPWPPARNPWRLDHVTGGSSSGSGAAVAAGLALGALGSDTGGSIRNPAGMCGLVGLKPTYGLVSRRGVIANSWSFDHAGPMAWTVEDVAIMLQALARFDPLDPASARVEIPDYRAALSGDVRGLRIGVVRHFYEDDVAVGDEVHAAMEAALAVLARLGARLEDVRLRPAQAYYDVKLVGAESELYSVHEADLRARPRDFGADFLGRALGACLMTGADYLRAQRERRTMIAEMAPVHARFDALVTAGPGPAAPFGEWRVIRFWQRPSLATPFNVIGGPALVQCMGFTATGLPMSLQIAGRPFDESTVLRVADAYERATPWRERRPDLDPSPSAPPLLPAPPPQRAECSNAERDAVAVAVRRAGLVLDEDALEQLCATAPWVAAMTGRLRRDLAWRDEPASVFSLPGG